MARCFACGAQLDPRQKVFRSTLCPVCGKDVRVCLNCNFYQKGAHWDCREEISEEVRDKDRANFCEFFALAEGEVGDLSARSKAAKKAEDARSKFDNLFGND